MFKDMWNNILLKEFELMNKSKTKIRIDITVQHTLDTEVVNCKQMTNNHTIKGKTGKLTLTRLKEFT